MKEAAAEAVAYHADLAAAELDARGLDRRLDIADALILIGFAHQRERALEFGLDIGSSSLSALSRQNRSGASPASAGRSHLRLMSCVDAENLLDKDNRGHRMSDGSAQ
jgi:hypothetical protein